MPITMDMAVSLRAKNHVIGEPLTGEPERPPIRGESRATPTGIVEPVAASA